MKKACPTCQGWGKIKIPAILSAGIPAEITDCPDCGGSGEVDDLDAKTKGSTLIDDPLRDAMRDEKGNPFLNP